MLVEVITQQKYNRKTKKIMNYNNRKNCELL